MSASRHKGYAELRVALAAEGCSVCRLTEHGLRRYFDLLTYERVTDVELRGAIRAARGFCASHGQMLHEARSALGSAIVYRDVLNSAAQILEAGAGKNASLGSRLRQALGSEALGAPQAELLEPQQECPACRYGAELAGNAIDMLTQSLGEDELLPVFRTSAGLCLPHVRQTLRRTGDPARLERFRQAQLAVWRRLIDQLDELIRKHDHRFADELVGDEADAWARAIALASGRAGLA